MNSRASIPLFIAALGFGLVTTACDDSLCQPDGSCLRSGFSCDYDDICKRNCTSDIQCGPAAHCVVGIGLCRAGEQPSVQIPASDAGSSDAATSDGGSTKSDAGPSCIGGEGCSCYGNQTCSFGFECAEGTCVDATGDLDQPCFANGTCNDDLGCVGRAPGPRVCRRDTEGGVGESCFDTASAPDAQPCRSVSAACEAGVCRGGSHDTCSEHADCRVGFGCEDGMCRSDRGRCESRAECGGGQFCCGEAGTQFAAEAACPVGISEGDCFDAPIATYAVSCGGNEDCVLPPPRSPDMLGVSMCLPRDVPVCSAPCAVTADDPGCPNGWSCSPSWLGCFTKEDCGIQGLACVGADRRLARLGRCQCDPQEDPVAACRSASDAAGLPSSTCVISNDQEAFCTAGSHCEAPRP